MCASHHFGEHIPHILQFDEAGGFLGAPLVDNLVHVFNGFHVRRFGAHKKQGLQGQFVKLVHYAGTPEKKNNYYIIIQFIIKKEYIISDVNNMNDFLYYQACPLRWYAWKKNNLNKFI